MHTHNWPAAPIVRLNNTQLTLPSPYYTIATAEQYFLKFYATFTPEQHQPTEIAQTCLFLACKVEETMKKFKEIIVEAGPVLQIKSVHGWNLEEQGAAIEVERIKTRLLQHEQTLLETIGFDFRTFQPQKFAVKIVKKLEEWKLVQPDEAKALGEAAWTICIDALATSIVVRYSQFRVALAAVHLASVELDISIKARGEGNWMCRFPNSNGLSTDDRAGYHMNIGTSSVYFWLMCAKMWPEK